jgi:DNA ligase-1
MDKFIKTNVGSGLTDTDRETFWEAKDKLIGQIVEVRADAITQNQETTDEWSLRFPRFLRFRGFEPGEKL